MNSFRLLPVVTAAVLLIVGCGKTAYFGVEDEALRAPKDFSQTVKVIEKAKVEAEAGYQQQKIEEAMAYGKMAAETYWACNDEEAKALLALARQSAMRSEMYHPQPPPPESPRATDLIFLPAPPENLLPGTPFSGISIRNPEMIIETTRFDFDSEELDTDSKIRLEEHLPVLTRQGEYEIAGHTDNVGAEGYNQRLSERRAGSVEAYLKGKGVSARKMASVGYGEAHPIADNTTAVGRAENRRTEIRVKPPVIPEPDKDLSTLEPGKTFAAFYFPYGATSLIPLHTTALDQLAVILKRYPRIQFESAGYSDDTGPPAINRKLSEERARTVADYLIQKGVSAYQIRVKGYGEADPVLQNQSSEDRAWNRRVEIRVVR